MKLTAILLLSACLQISAKGFSQDVTLSEKNVSLQKIFYQIHKQTGYQFFYEDEMLKNAGRINIKVTNMPLEKVLAICFKGLPLSYAVVNNVITLKRKAEDFIQTVEAPSFINIKGTVKDAQGNALAGVSVIVKGTKRGTSTGAEGSFSINANVGDVLEFSFVGYKNKNVTLGNSNTLSVVMQIEATLGNEVVVVGYGTQKKKDVVGAISVLTSKDIGNQPITSVANALEGRVTGLQIIQGSAQPGNDQPTITIRGIGTVRSSIAGDNSDASPLILVDGVQSTMDDINPNDIESFTILKDASSAAIYGARGANGVILITTKRGKGGKPVINFSTYQAWQTATATPKVLDVVQYMTLKNVAQANAGLAQLYPDALIADIKTGNNPNFPKPGYTPFDDGFIKNAPMANYYLSVRGANEHVKYAISAGYLDQDGIVLNTGSKRYNFRSNIDIDINKVIRAGLSLSGSYTNSYEPNYQGNGVGQFIRGIVGQNPPVTPQFFNGIPAWGNSYLTAAQVNNGRNDIVVNKYGGVNKTKIYRATPDVYVEIEPFKGLVFKADASIYVSDTKASNFRSPITASDGATVTSQNGIGILTNTDNTTVNSSLNFTGTYSKKINNSQINGLVGASSITQVTNGLSGSNQGYSGLLTQLNAGTLTPSVGGSETSWELASIFGRVDYNYAEKYFAEATLRQDGSSRFGSANQYAVFPSFSIGWNIASENFLKGNPNVNQLKLRADWGQLGNQNIGNYSSITTIVYNSPYVFGNTLVSGAAQGQLGNPDVKWETSTSTDIGVDGVFLNYKLNITADYYTRISSNLLVSPPISAVFGNVTVPTQNVGSVENKGYELMASYKGDIGSDFGYFVSANWTHNDNKVTKLNSTFIIGNSLITQEGQPINSQYGNLIIGIFQSNADAQNTAKYGLQPGGKNTKAGDYIYKDTNGDGIVNSDDRVILGNTNLVNNYGFSLGINYKGFDFKTLFYGVLGRDVQEGTFGTDGLRAQGNVLAKFLNAWTPENTHTDVPRVATGYNYNTFLQVGPLISSAVVNASYLRMRSIELGYTLPKAFLSKFKITNLRFYVAGQNLLTFARAFKKELDGFDPEQYAQGASGNDQYPNAKTFSVGASLSF